MQKAKKHYKDLVLRIYWQHDLDLVSLWYHKDFSFPYWMKRALIAFVRNDQAFSIPIPKESPVTLEHKNKKIHIRLSEEEEGDIIEFVENFRYGFANNGIKQIMRSYLTERFLDVYMQSSSYTLKPVEPKTPAQIYKKKHREDYTAKAFTHNQNEENKTLKEARKDGEKN